MTTSYANMAENLGEPRVEIVHQIFRQRFRYETENRTARKTTEKLMKLKLQNIPQGSVLRMFCVCENDKRVVHPNTLDGINCRNGVYIHPRFENDIQNSTISIAKLQINRMQKNNMRKALTERAREIPDQFLGGLSEMQKAVENKTKIDSNNVSICVHVSTGEKQAFVTSTRIKNEECQNVRIEEISESSCYATGGRIFIFTAEDSPCIKPKMFDVRVEEKDNNGGVAWSSEWFLATHGTIKYKHVIRYTVPPYKTPQISTGVNVFIVLRCRETSEEDSIPFEYKPLADYVSKNKRKPSVLEKYGHLGQSPSKVMKMRQLMQETTQGDRAVARDTSCLMMNAVSCTQSSPRAEQVLEGKQSLTTPSTIMTNKPTMNMGPSQDCRRRGKVMPTEWKDDNQLDQDMCEQERHHSASTPGQAAACVPMEVVTCGKDAQVKKLASGDDFNMTNKQNMIHNSFRVQGTVSPQVQGFSGAPQVQGTVSPQVQRFSGPPQVQGTVSPQVQGFSGAPQVQETSELQPISDVGSDDKNLSDDIQQVDFDMLLDEDTKNQGKETSNGELAASCSEVQDQNLSPGSLSELNLPSIPFDELPLGSTDLNDVLKNITDLL